jgi:hypothetical protein
MFGPGAYRPDPTEGITAIADLTFRIEALILVNIQASFTALPLRKTRRIR